MIIIRLDILMGAKLSYLDQSIREKNTKFVLQNIGFKELNKIPAKIR